MEFLVRNGLTKEGFKRRLKEGARAVSQELIRRDQELERQERKESFEQTKYHPGTGIW